MGRLKDKLAMQQNYQPEYEQPPEEFTEEEIADYYYQQQLAEQQYQAQQQEEADEEIRKENAMKSPLAILDEIKEKPSPKGTFPVLIGGRPIDLHILEDYIVKISPHALKTILRYHNARTIEEIKSYSTGPSLKAKGSGFWILIIALIGIVVLGIVVMMFSPQLTQMMKNFAP